MKSKIDLDLVVIVAIVVIAITGIIAGACDSTERCATSCGTAGMKRFEPGFNQICECWSPTQTP